jgi:predicted O-methyltransferase YrrM
VSEAGIDLLFIDADGDVGRDIERYWNLLNNNCILILDDYYTSEAPEKQTLVQKWVNNAKMRGTVCEYCIVKWGTWIGKLDKTKKCI